MKVNKATGGVPLTPSFAKVVTFLGNANIECKILRQLADGRFCPYGCSPAGSAGIILVINPWFSGESRYLCSEIMIADRIRHFLDKL